jgi:predicted MFS family arabinose efflux permease
MATVASPSAVETTAGLHPAAEPQDKKRKWTVIILCFFGFMTYSVVRMVMSGALGLIARDFGLNNPTKGLLLSSFFYGFVAFLFIGGLLSDRWSGKPVMIAGLFLFSLATFATGLSTGLLTMIVYRILTGIGEGVFWPAASCEVARVTTPEERSTIMAFYWCGYPIGGSVGILLGTALGPRYGWHVVFFVAGGLGLLVAFLYGVLVKSQPGAGIAQKPSSAANPVPLRELITNPTIFLLGLYFFLVMCGWWIVLLWAPMYLMTAKHLSLGLGGVISSSLGFSGAVGAIIIGRYCDKGSLQRPKTALIVMTLVSSLLMAGLVLTLPTWLTAITMLALGFFGYPLTPILLSVVSQIVPKSITGSSIGFVMNFGMLGGAVSPVALGVLTGRYGMSAIWFWAAIVLGMSSLCLFGANKFRQCAT